MSEQTHQPPNGRGHYAWRLGVTWLVAALRKLLPNLPRYTVQAILVGGLLFRGGSALYTMAAGTGPGAQPDTATGAGSITIDVLANDRGLLDVITGTGNTSPHSIALNDGSGGFTGNVSTASGGNKAAANSAALGDVDGDDDLDLVVGVNFNNNEIYLNDGSGNFPTSPNFTFGLGHALKDSVALGDLDKDGSLDVVLGNSSNYSNEVFLNDGSGSFATAADFTFGVGKSYSVALGDLDCDGDLDVVVANSYWLNEVHLNDGSGSFATSADFTFGATTGNESRSSSVALGDVDGDGKLDAVVANYGVPDEVYLNNGSGSFASSANFTFGGTTVTDGSNSQAVALGDVNDDGQLDVVVGNNCYPGEVYLNDGSGSYASAASFTFFYNHINDVALGDVNADGSLDAVVATEGGADEVYLNDGSGSFATSPSFTFGATTGDSSYSNFVVLGDLDNDGAATNPAGIEILEPPCHGAITNINDSTGEITYTPTAGFEGTDTFTYRSSSGVTTVEVKVVPGIYFPIIFKAG